MELILTRVPALKIKYFTEKAIGEISGMAKSHYDEEKDEIVVDDCVIFEQKCTSANTDISDEAMAKFMYKLRQDGENPKDWNLWWHSHASMGVFWSGTDDQTIKDEASDYLVSLVTNKKGEFKARLDVFPTDNSPFKKEMFKTYDLDVKLRLGDEGQEKEIEDLIKMQLEIDDRIDEIKNGLYEDETIKEECEKDVDEKVDKPYQFSSGKTHKQFHQSSFNDYENRNGIWTPKNGKKKEVKKRKNHYDGNNDSQDEFERSLDEIVVNATKRFRSETVANEEEEYNYEHIEDVPDDRDIEGYLECDYCGDPIDFCSCGMHKTKEGGTITSLNNFLKREDLNK